MRRRLAVGAFFGVVAGATATACAMTAAHAMLPAATFSAEADLFWNLYVAAVSALPIWATVGAAVGLSVQLPGRRSGDSPRREPQT